VLSSGVPVDASLVDESSALPPDDSSLGSKVPPFVLPSSPVSVLVLAGLPDDPLDSASAPAVDSLAPPSANPPPIPPPGVSVQPSDRATQVNHHLICEHGGREQRDSAIERTADFAVDRLRRST
jgi:hypothetical protein